MSSYNTDADNAGYVIQKNLIEMLGRSTLNIFDVGGNIGQSIEKYRQTFKDCNVFSFEPHPKTFAVLRDRYENTPGIRCEQLALGTSKGTSVFYATKCAEASSLLAPEEFVRERSVLRNYDYDLLNVQVDTLDCIVRRLNIASIDILKIDVQGSELAVLQGAESLLQKERIDIIYSEVLFAENYSGQCDFADIWNYLKKFGYVLWNVFPFLYTDLGRLWTGNALFISSRIRNYIDPN